MEALVSRRRRRPHNVVRRAALASAALLALTACGGGGGSDDGSEDPIRILFVGGKSGPTAQIVADVTRGTQAAIDAINEDGGVDGRQLELEVLDDAGDPTRAVSELQKRLSSGDKPDLVMPGVTSAESLAMLPVLTRQKIISANNAASPLLNDPEKYPYHFGYTPSTDRQQGGLPANLKELGAKKVVALVGNDEYGKGMGAAVEQNLEGSGIDVTIETFNLADLDLSVSYERALSKNPDAIYFEAIGEPAQRLVKAREVVGATDVPTLGGFGIFASAGGPSVFASEKANENLWTQVFSAQKYVPEADRSDELSTFLAGGGSDGYKGGVLSPMISFDIANIYAAAVEAAGSTDGDAVKKALEDPDTEYPELLLWSEHHWTADDHMPNPKSSDLSMVPRGEIVDGMFKPIGG